MIIATASISGSAMTRIPMNVAVMRVSSSRHPRQSGGPAALQDIRRAGFPRSREWRRKESLRRLLVLDAGHKLLGAAAHRRARAADGVGQEEVGDRIADRSFGLRSEPGRRPF